MSDTDKEELRRRLKLVGDALKDLPGVGASDIRSSIDGRVSISKKGVLKMTLSFDAKEMLHSPAHDVRDVLNGNWKVVPLLVFVSNE